MRGGGGREEANLQALVYDKVPESGTRSVGGGFITPL